MFSIITESDDLNALGKLMVPYLYNPIAIYTASHKNIFAMERKKERKHRYFQTICGVIESCIITFELKDCMSPEP